MSALTFTLKTAPQQRVDLSALTPDALAGKSLADIAAIELPSGHEQPRVDALFDISGDDATDIVIKNATDRLDYIGHGMRSGRITVHGNVGSYLAFKLRKGEIVLHGNAGDFAASGMAGGLLHVHGNVGDFLASAIIGERRGMKGGTVIITGNAGERAGDQMRRGLVLIEGNVGSYCASRMIAGTIGVMGSTGEYLAYGMRRGTVLLNNAPKLHATIQDCGSHTLPFLSLMFKSFRDLPTKFAAVNRNRVQRYAGDIANDGKGEILVFK
ncbi:formylmethanofuran dehydrogenase subunit C [Methylovorus sp. MP688]|uniref:formylmethanofuran dehydrogenase subunit C n=1 Tax=Methylovorus sp. (strain MP688) TaxID=887061 RepID=UPI0001EC4755|nr:formylmethanofuran dehydrogenase subunit C [Methylovorus sp. MP688]ADQ84727.1 formylmethanofuran dehydrogenase subunit C [Methylovorus sp. MP688]